jgi:signal transduction histidine kinase
VQPALPPAEDYPASVSSSLLPGNAAYSRLSLLVLLLTAATSLLHAMAMAFALAAWLTPLHGVPPRLTVTLGMGIVASVPLWLTASLVWLHGLSRPAEARQPVDADLPGRVLLFTLASTIAGWLAAISVSRMRPEVLGSVSSILQLAPVAIGVALAAALTMQSVVSMALRRGTRRAWLSLAGGTATPLWRRFFAEQLAALALPVTALLAIGTTPGIFDWRVDGGRYWAAAVSAGALWSAALALVLWLSRDLAQSIGVMAGEMEQLGKATRLEEGDERDPELGTLPGLAPPETLDDGNELGELRAVFTRLRVKIADDDRRYQKELAQARAADDEKQAFLQMVNDRLRAPMRAIDGHLAQLLGGQRGDLSADQRSDLSAIGSANRQLAGLIDDIVDLSALETGQLAIQPEDLDLREMIEQVTRAAAASVPSDRQVVVRAEIPESLPVVRGDRRRLRQVMENLLGNASKFTRQGEIVVTAGVTVQDGQQLVRVAVRDTGPGIAAPDVPLLFEEYRQVGSGRQKAQGSGLGLAICRRIVELHDGSISVHSQLGRGSTFSFELPVLS